VYYPDDVLELGRPILAGGAVPVEMLWLLEDANVAFFLLGGGRGRVGGWGVNANFHHRRSRKKKGTIHKSEEN
jgi:hypothetical protein